MSESAPFNLFTTEDYRALFHNKHIVVIGDSIQRSVYKDVVLALQSSRYLVDKETRSMPVESVVGDSLVDVVTPASNSKEFYEHREFLSGDGRHLVEYYYVTRCYNDRIKRILLGWRTGRDPPPDLVIMNSCLWDISRYGPYSAEQYTRNLTRLCEDLVDTLPPLTTFIWTTTLPVSSDIGNAGFLHEEISFLKDQLRVAILEANYYAAQAMASHSFDVLDLNYHLRPFIKDQRRCDGVHWKGMAHRHMTEIIATFLYDSWGLNFPKDAHECLVKMRSQYPDLSKEFPHLGIGKNLDGSRIFPEFAVKFTEPPASRKDESRKRFGRRVVCDTSEESASDRERAMRRSRRNSRSPGRRFSRSPGRHTTRWDRRRSRSLGLRRRSRSPGRRRTRSRSSRRSRSPPRCHSRSRSSCRSGSLARRSTRSQSRRRSRSPARRRSRSPARRRMRSRSRRRSRSRSTCRSRSPARRHTRSRSRRRSRSPARRRMRSRSRHRLNSPARRRSRSPNRKKRRSASTESKESRRKQSRRDRSRSSVSRSPGQCSSSSTSTRGKRKSL